jgi:hypothetical protein
MQANQTAATVSNVICLTIDIDWAAPSVLKDLVERFDERGLKATFFCTHDGIEVPGHERALHPNFRHRGDTMRKLRSEFGAGWERLTEAEIYEYVVRTTCGFCPEAKGVRAHSLLYDSILLPIYHAAGLEYASNYLLPFEPNLRPVWKEYDLLELPIYFNDHFYLKSRGTSFDTADLKLGQAGMKVVQFHPNMVFLNAPTDKHYQENRVHYHEPEELRKNRYAGRGVRTLFLDVLDAIVSKRLPTMTLGEVNALWRGTGMTRRCEEMSASRSTRA